MNQLFCDVLKTVCCTFQEMTHALIRSTYLLTKWFHTENLWLWCKQLLKQYASYYKEFLKEGFQSIRRYIVILFYNNKVGFKKIISLKK